MDPVTMAIVGGSLLSAWGQIKSGQAEAAASEQNALIAEENANLSLIKGAEEERRLRVQGAKALGDIRVGYASSGVTMEGSALDVLKSSAANVELDALMARFEGQSKAIAFRNQARLDRMRGEAAGQAGMLGGLGTLLMAGGNAYSKTGKTPGDNGGSISLGTRKAGT